MTTTLTFRYIVVEGDSTTSFDILDTRTTNRQRFSTALVRVPAAEVQSPSQFRLLMSDPEHGQLQSTPLCSPHMDLCEPRQLRPRTAVIILASEAPDAPQQVIPASRGSIKDELSHLVAPCRLSQRFGTHQIPTAPLS